MIYTDIKTNGVIIGLTITQSELKKMFSLSANIKVLDKNDDLICTSIA